MGCTPSLFIVERYWPGVTLEGLREAAARLAAVAGETARHVESTLLPGEEYVFSLFEGISPDAVAALNLDAGVPFDRVVPAVVVQP